MNALGAKLGAVSMALCTEGSTMGYLGAEAGQGDIKDDELYGTQQQLA